VNESDIPAVNSRTELIVQYKLVSERIEDSDQELDKYLKLVNFLFNDYNLSSSGLILKGN